MTKHVKQMTDRGERYRIVAVNHAGQEITFGWSDDPEAWAGKIAQHPAWRERIVIDRGGKDA